MSTDKFDEIIKNKQFLEETFDGLMNHKMIKIEKNYSEAYIKNLTKEIFNKKYIKNNYKGSSGGILTTKSLKYLNSL